MGTKVSVILPVYNVSDYLRQCMDSIVGQTLKDIEIICVDDGSTDDSLAILKEYEAKDQRVKVIQQANAGAGAARNKGLEIATGEYLSFLDSDDFFEPDMLEKAIPKRKKKNWQICRQKRSLQQHHRCLHFQMQINLWKKQQRQTTVQMQQKQRRIKLRKQRIHRKMQIRQQMHQRMQMSKQKQQKQ